MEFGATLAYVQSWTGRGGILANTEMDTLDLVEGSFVPTALVMYPETDTSRQAFRASMVDALQKDRVAVLDGFELFQSHVLLGDTCISKSAEALTERISHLLAQKPIVPNRIPSTSPTTPRTQRSQSQESPRSQMSNGAMDLDYQPSTTPDLSPEISNETPPAQLLAHHQNNRRANLATGSASQATKQSSAIVPTEPVRPPKKIKKYSKKS